MVSAPAIKGTPAIGQTLNVDNGTWSVNNLAFTYAWMRNGVPVPGATTGGYTITAADAASGDLRAGGREHARPGGRDRRHGTRLGAPDRLQDVPVRARPPR